MEVVAKLMQQAASKPGVGEVRICYSGATRPTYHAFAMPNHDTAQSLAIAEFRNAGFESVTFNELADATARRAEHYLHHGQGHTPEEAVRALLVGMCVSK